MGIFDLFKPKAERIAKEKVKLLMKVLKATERPGVAVEGSKVEWAIGEIGIGRSEVELLVKLIKNENLKLGVEDRYVRKAGAMLALGKIGDPRAVGPLVQVLMSDEDIIFRMPAAEALGEIRDPRVVVPLIQALKNETGSVFFAIIARALMNIGESVVDPLIQSLKDKNATGRAHIAAILGAIQNPRAVEPLIELLKNKGEDGTNRISAAEALGNIEDVRAIQPLEEAMGNDVSIRVAGLDFDGRMNLGEAAKVALEKINSKRVRGRP